MEADVNTGPVSTITAKLEADRWSVSAAGPGDELSCTVALVGTREKSMSPGRTFCHEAVLPVTIAAIVRSAATSAGDNGLSSVQEGIAASSGFQEPPRL